MKCSILYWKILLISIYYLVQYESLKIILYFNYMLIIYILFCFKILKNFILYPTLKVCYYCSDLYWSPSNLTKNCQFHREHDKGCVVISLIIFNKNWCSIKILFHLYFRKRGVCSKIFKQSQNFKVEFTSFE